MGVFDKLITTFLPIVPKPIVFLVSKKYIAGAHLDDAVRVVKKLNQMNCMATIDVLGESAKSTRECQEAVIACTQVLDAIHEQKLDSGISVKPTQLGLLIDKALCYQNLKKIAQKASTLDIFLRIDMEDASTTSDTIELYKKIHDEFPLTGIVIQAYLRRSLDDVKALCQGYGNFRLCKGIYIEPRQIAYKEAQIINDNFTYLTELMIKSNGYLGIATHDEHLVWQTLKLLDKHPIDKNRYEFQMLLGVDEPLRDIILSSGHRLRIYVPFGQNWYAYCIRRLKENPKIAIYVIKAFLKIS